MSNAGLLNPFGNGGRTDSSAYYSNLDKNLVLSASDMGKLITISKSNGYGVVLPDARQLIKNVVVNIANKSTTPISVFNNNGQILKVIPINQTIICNCTGKLSSSGVWTTTILGTSLMNSIGVNAPTQLATISGTTVVTGSVSVCPISSTVTCITWMTPALNIYAGLIIRNSANAVYMNSPVLVHTHVAPYIEYSPRAVTVSSNSAFVAFPGYNGGPSGYGISWNPTTYVFDAVSSNTRIGSWGPDFNYSQFYACILPTSNSVVVSGTNFSNSKYYAGVGTATLTNGNVVANGAFIWNYVNLTAPVFCQGLVAVSSTIALVLYINTVDYNATLFKCTVGAGSISASSSLTLGLANNGNGPDNRIVVLSPTTAIVFSCINNVSAQLINITDMSILSTTTFTAVSSPNSVSAAYLSADSVIVTWKTTIDIKTAKVTVSGTTMVMSNIIIVSSTAGNPVVCGLSNTSAIAITKVDSGSTSSTVYGNVVIVS